MAEGYDDDSDGKDTQILPAVDSAPKDLEGTVEMDRDALLRRLQADARARHKSAYDEETFEGEYVPDPTEQVPRTLQMEAVEEETSPSKTTRVPAIDVKTQHYQVPDSIMDRLRAAPDDLHTLDVSLELIQAATGRASRPTQPLESSDVAEFQAFIDDRGRIVVPTSLVAARFKPGARVHVVVSLVEDSEA